MKIKADLHTHFSTLGDIGDNIFDKAINTAQKNLGIGGIFAAVNGQNVEKDLGRYENFLKQCGRTKVVDLDNAFYVSGKNIYVVKGQEVFTQGGHILILGLNYGKNLKDYKTLEDSLKEARDYNGIIIADHPWFIDGIFKKGNFKSKVISQLDGVEVHNGEAWIPIPGNSNKKAQEYYNDLIKEHLNIGAISASDGHSVREIGSSYSVLEQPDFSSPEKLIETLRKSIREHKDWKDDKQTNSYWGGINHAFKLAPLRLASKLGMIDRIN